MHAAAAAGREKKAAEKRAQGQPEKGPSLTKSRAKELVGRLVEVYWDGEDAWYKAEVLRFDEASRAHTLRYTADGYECEEKLSDSSWRGPLPRPTARTAAKRSREG
ncbi:hypothetical protein EMIHUDRAFT_219128 [Emiliania huxleyi CCMP1516]|uniref:Tudor domain-containing protein n=2 Tax=Emiliania huxleyi TaxID=2903 RepID=A0A0D3I5R1_EMIH1|nr:hypothetical protein EMIHUDRAFT_219128 [Emiliania huxleyi CCMP1516]EOD06596.1 hypothetical protein EMIHUDRAFT_219128 [Emiliania huxleyi CCMP1516]|eukprot:XP_005759025.1 hypothetical protein EMIHUDRAFT_219128 [Emiliania huxleyi CCMP1516]